MSTSIDTQVVLMLVKSALADVGTSGLYVMDPIQRKVQKRAHCSLESLLAYANGEVTAGQAMRRSLANPSGR